MKHVLPLRPVLCQSIGLDCCGVYLEHFFFDIAHLLLNVIHTVTVGVAAVFCSLAQHLLGRLSPINPVYLTHNVAAKNLHLAGLGCHAHVRRGLSLRS